MGPRAFTDVGKYAMEQAAQAAVLSTTAQDLADQIAIAFGQTALALASGITMTTPAIEHQTRTKKLVTTVVKAPLFTLIAANLLLAVFGLDLAVTAYSTLVSGRGVRDVQARLGSTGLVAQIFDGDREEDVTSLEGLFGERNIASGRKVGILENGGKWEFLGFERGVI
jgi:hypothetical protein